MSLPVDGKEFLRVTLPALKTGQVSNLAHAVKIRWHCREITPLLRHPDPDVRRVAALALGLTGSNHTALCLAKSLRDPDPTVNQMAEHGLWSIWFRGGKPQAVKPFREGVTLLTAESYERAVGCFEEAILLDPQFAEAFNQCAIAHFFVSDWERCVDYCRGAVNLMPCHFGAMAGMGHGYLQMGDQPRALICYRKALHINPRMPAISSLVERLGWSQKEQNDYSGLYELHPVMQ